MMDNLLVTEQRDGEADFEIRLDYAEPMHLSMGQLEAIARGLTIGEYRKSFEFEENIHTEAACTDEGVHIRITIGDEVRYESTTDLASYFQLTRSFCNLCNLHHMAEPAQAE